MRRPSAAAGVGRFWRNLSGARAEEFSGGRGRRTLNFDFEKNEVKFAPDCFWDPSGNVRVAKN